jgi:hypothetical protein
VLLRRVTTWSRSGIRLGGFVIVAGRVCIEVPHHPVITSCTDDIRTSVVLHRYSRHRCLDVNNAYSLTPTEAGERYLQFQATYSQRASIFVGSDRPEAALVRGSSAFLCLRASAHAVKSVAPLAMLLRDSWTWVASSESSAMTARSATSRCVDPSRQLGEAKREREPQSPIFAQSEQRLHEPSFR